MGTIAEGKRTRRIIREYHDGKEVEAEDREMLESMSRAPLSITQSRTASSVPNPVLLPDALPTLQPELSSKHWCAEVMW